ncbi:MAG: hypothetical protein Q8M02_09655 [Candidatus Didemnitutus sp.]|nr:hypothetical protein [Candidatus Didemnitutus sp.]
MNSSYRFSCAFIFALLTATTFAQSSERLTWNFNDPAKTQLTALNPAWTNDLDQTTTTGKGALRIRRTINTPANSFAELPASFGKQPLWILVRVSAWSLSGTTNESVRLGLSSNDEAKSPSVIAQVKFERVEKEMKLTAESFPSSLPGSSLATATVGKGAAGGGVTVLLHIDPVSRTYRASYKLAKSKDWLPLGEGTISKGRTAKFVRLGLSGPFDTNRPEQFDLDEIIVSTSDLSHEQ